MKTFFLTLILGVFLSISADRAYGLDSYRITRADCLRWLANASDVFTNPGLGAQTPLFVLQSQDGRTVSFGPNLQRNPDLVSLKIALTEGGTIEGQFKEVGHTFYRPRSYNLIFQKSELVGVIEGKIIVVAQPEASLEKQAWLIDYRTSDADGSTEMFPLYEDSHGISHLVFFEGSEGYDVSLRQALTKSGSLHKIDKVERINFEEQWGHTIELGSEPEPERQIAVLKNGFVFTYLLVGNQNSKRPIIAFGGPLRQPPTNDLDIKNIKVRSEVRDGYYWLGFDLIYGDQLTDDHTETYWLRKLRR